MDSSLYLRSFSRIRIWVFLACCLTLCLPGYAQNLASANRAYQAAQYEEAIQRYERLLQQGYQSAALYHNLGNACYRAGQLGRAVLYYERALKLEPGDGQVIQNLQVVRAQLPGQPSAIFVEPGILRAWKSLQGALSANSWAALGLACLWLGISGLLVWLFHWARRYKKAGFTAGLALIVLSLLPFLLAYGRTQQQYRQHYAVLLLPQTELRAGPEAESQALQPLYEGAKVQILDRLGQWYFVRLPDATQGWLPMDAAVGI
jgi:tetratricopeptide (TPR) repeat protein